MKDQILKKEMSVSVILGLKDDAKCHEHSQGIFVPSLEHTFPGHLLHFLLIFFQLWPRAECMHFIQ